MRPGWEGIFAVRLVRAWVRFYTRGLPTLVAEARRAEIDSDLWEQLHDASRAGRPVPSLSVLGRFARGVPGDLAWRLESEPLSGSPVQRVVLPVVVVLSYGWLVFAWMSGWLGETLVWWILLLPVLVTAPLLALYARRCSGRLARAGLALVLCGGATVALMLAVLAAMVYFFEPMPPVWVAILVLLGGFSALIGSLAFGVANLYERTLPRWNALPLIVAVFPFAVGLPQALLLLSGRRPAGSLIRIWSGVNLIAVLGFVVAYTALVYVIWRDTFRQGPSDEIAPQA